MTEARCQDVEMKTKEAHVHICTDTERQREDFKKNAREKLHEGYRVVKDGECKTVSYSAGCADTDTCTKRGKRPHRDV